MPPNWSKKWGKNHMCPISNCRLRQGNDINGYSYVIKTKCSHRFYRKSLLEWANNCLSKDKNITCPMCRKNIELSIFIT
jgi:hypothetical protein